jgi:hypothetical protein
MVDDKKGQGDDMELGGLANMDKRRQRRNPPPPPQEAQPSVTTEAQPSLAPPLVKTEPPVTAVPSQAPKSVEVQAPVEDGQPELAAVPSRRKMLIPPVHMTQKHTVRVPRSFRVEAHLIEYLERHELYKAALKDNRPFSDKLNEWIQLKMAEENPVLLRAEDDVEGLGAEEVQEAAQTEQEPPEDGQGDEKEEETPAKSPPPAPQTPPKKEKSVWKVAAGSRLPGSLSS